MHVAIPFCILAECVVSQWEGITALEVRCRCNTMHFLICFVFQLADDNLSTRVLQRSKVHCLRFVTNALLVQFHNDRDLFLQR